MTEFLTNPINTAISGVVILAVVGAALYVVLKRGVKYSKEGGFAIDDPSERMMLDKIPEIDRMHQNKMREVTSDNKDVFLALMRDIKDKKDRMIVLFKFLDTFRYRIYINHLTRKLSDPVEYKKYLEAIIQEVTYKMVYVADYANVDYHDDAILAPAVERVTRHAFFLIKPVLLDMVQAKISWYATLPKSARTDELISKNKRYLEGLEEFKPV